MSSGGGILGGLVGSAKKAAKQLVGISTDVATGGAVSVASGGTQGIAGETAKALAPKVPGVTGAAEDLGTVDNADPNAGDRSAEFAAKQDALARRAAAGSLSQVGSDQDLLGYTSASGPKRRSNSARALLGG